MDKLRGVRPAGAGIEIRWQVRGRRHSLYQDRPPTPANLEDAARYRRRLIESSRLGEPEAQTAKTVEQCCTAFLKDKAKSLKPSTTDNYRSKLEVYWSGIGSLPIRTVRIADLKRIDRETHWNSQKTRRDAHALIRAVFKWAMHEDLCDSNPAAALKAGAWQRPEIDAFTDDERLAIVAELTETARVFYGLMFETGARTGELMALQWSDVGEDSMRISTSTYRGEIGTTKTHQARTVLLTKAAQQLLASHTSTRFAKGAVFLTQYGTPYSNDRGLTTAFKNACRRAGVRYRRPYYCRHTFASRAITAGAEPSWVARQMGDRVETVMRHYAQWISGDKDRKELEKMEVGNQRG